jgi:hypothetical protein
MARAYVLVGIVLALAGRALAGGGPLHVAVECEDPGRTKACPAFLLGFIDAHPVLLSAPRASADVVVYLTARPVALDDHVHMRFVGMIKGAPPVVEIEVDLDSRADDDTQRAKLEPAFLRGLALFVGVGHPDAVEVTLGKPSEPVTQPGDTKSWDLAVSLGGNGNWTEKYQSYHANSSIVLTWLREDARLLSSITGIGGVNRQPPLVLADGTQISVDTTQWSINADLEGAWLANDHWSFGAQSRAWKDDPLGQYRYGWNARLAVELDAYPSNDPRGNRLSLAYFAGYQLEGYNLRDVLGETYAMYPIHGLSAAGSVRHDQTALGIALSLTAEVLDPGRRHSVSAAPFLEWKLGGHVDLDLSFSITKRQIVAPDANLIDPMNYAQLSRLSYAEPLAMTGFLNITVHWDRTNGLRNDRLSEQ